MIIVDCIGGKHEVAWRGDIAPTIKATHYKSPPCVLIVDDEARTDSTRIESESCNDNEQWHMTDTSGLVCTDDSDKH